MNGTRSAFRDSLLEHRTKLVPGEGRWEIGLYRGAGEAVGVFQSAAAVVRGRRVSETDHVADAARRARGRVRRYCAENGLNRLGTLTYGPPFQLDPIGVRSDVASFFRRLREQVG